MTIYQQYYTSFRHPTNPNRGGGFDVQAESPGMPDAARTMIKSVIGYRIATTRLSAPLDTHPVALRFQLLNTYAVLTCVQSSGKDEVGRDGNYFAHTLIGTPDEIAGSRHPIFSWKSDFWVSKDESHYESLPLLRSMDDVYGQLDPNHLWDFINQGERQTWLMKLICAVIDHADTKRTIVILDTDEAIAQWIACVTMAIPPVYRAGITFATYHHDPRIAPYLLVGTTRDSSFRFDADEYTRYFVLDAEEGKTSEVAPSDYATFVGERFNPDQFRTEVEDFFEWQAEYAHLYRGIGRHLDDQINFRRANHFRTLHRDSDSSVRAARMILRDSQDSALSERRVSDLRAALEIIGTTALTDPGALNEYIQALHALKTADRNFTQFAPDSAQLLVHLILQKRGEEAGLLLRASDDIFGVDAFAKALNSPDIQKLMSQGLNPTDFEQHALLWKLLDKKLEISLGGNPSSQRLLYSTFTAIGELASTMLPIPTDARSILSAAIGSISTNDFGDLLRSANQLKQQQTSNPVLEWLYYVKVQDLPLQSRSERGYWRLWELYPPLFEFELSADLTYGGTVLEMIQTIEDWCAALAPESSSRVIATALDHLWSQPGIKHRDLAHELLLLPKLGPHIPHSWKKELVAASMSDATISQIDERTELLYEDFLTTSLSPPMLGAIIGSLALKRKSLTDEDASHIRERLNDVDEDKYRDEASRLITEFFLTNPSRLVIAIYSTKHKQVFWELYWIRLEAELLKKRNARVFAKVLSLWFTKIVPYETSLPMIVPEFFLQLPSVLTRIRDSKDFHHIERELDQSLSGYSWHTLVKDFLTKSRRGLFGRF